MSDTFYDFEGEAAEPSTIRELSKGYHYYIRKRARDALSVADRKHIKLYFITVHKNTLYSSLVYDFGESHEFYSTEITHVEMNFSVLVHGVRGKKNFFFRLFHF